MKEPTTRGGRALRAWLNANKLNIPNFALKNNLQRVTVQRVISGDRRRVTVDLAMRIQRATNGDVPVDVWESDDPAAPPADDHVARPALTKAIAPPADSGPSLSPSAPPRCKVAGE